ncbi:hypothetical protein NECAME_10266 [Necator americanus]|uniref:Uncharacterized protein n=1 Tax=Necator americanus TaxID=51031 RepID=W2TAE8_NECAM|nr:hypothetical protein NECAME_10266 [Necator americanus]ETN78569.1 hypothetical protein NECAME_10266 [Necator americanus]
MEDESKHLKPEGLVMTAPLFEAQDLQEFLTNPPLRLIITGTTSKELDTADDSSGGYIMELLGLKNSEMIMERYREDLSSKKLLFNHTLETQAIFLSSYVVFLYSYANARHPAHTDDLSYIMGVHPFEHDANEAVLAVVYPRFFVDFVKTGRPRRDWTPLQPYLDNYMNIDVDVDNGTMPHMELHYESQVVSYWRGLKKYDKQLSALKKTVAITHDVSMSNDSGATATSVNHSTIIELFLPLFAVIVTVLLVGYLVRRRERQKANIMDENEKTPLFS